MLKYEPGCLARSLAGRDRGRFYIILEAADEYVALTDGNTRQMDRPKRKKKKHIQLQYPQDETMKQKLRGEKNVTDQEIRDFLEKETSSRQGGNK